MLEHLGKTGEKLLLWQGAEEVGIDNGLLSFADEADLILESAVVEARFATGRGIYHTEQSGGDIDPGHAPFERGCRKAAHVGQDTSAEAEEDRLARGTLLLEELPDAFHRVQRLMHRPEYRGSAPQATEGS